MIRLSRLGTVERPCGQPVTVGKDDVWGQFLADVGEAKDRFAGIGRAALVCNDSYWFAVGLFGLLAAGTAVVLPQNARPETLAKHAGRFDVLVGDDSSLPGCTYRLTCGERPWRGEIDPAGVIEFFTSGSTGEPKPIVRRLGELESELAALESAWGGMLADAPVLATVPHQHNYGMIFRLLWPLAAGRPFARFTCEYWESLLAEFPPGGIIVSSPAHLSRLGGLSALPVERRPRMVFSAGAPLSFSAAQACKDVLGCLPTEILGSTETGAFATRCQDAAETPWRAIAGNRVGMGQDSRLRLLVPYLGDGRFTELADRITLVPDGRFHLQGRTDRVVKIEGKRIDLGEIEAALRALAVVSEAVAVTIDDGRAVLGAVVVPSAEGWAVLSEIGAFRFGRKLRFLLADRLEPTALPRRWRFLKTIPSDSMGKHRVMDLQALFAEEPANVE